MKPGMNRPSPWWLTVEDASEPESGFRCRGLVHEFDAWILEPSIVGAPCLGLGHDFVTHHSPAAMDANNLLSARRSTGFVK